MASGSEPRDNDGTQFAAPPMQLLQQELPVNLQFDTLIQGRYEPIRWIGSGGVGIVLAARHAGFDELVALKFLRPEFASHAEAVSRFNIEARASFKLRSEHVARVLDVDVHEGVPFIAMELLDGVDLRNVLERHSVLAPETAVDYALQVCEALSSAHSLGIIHRDIKPENLFLLGEGDERDHLKVLDFGISKVALVNTGRSSTQQALTRVAVGTPPYMSPEQIRAAHDLDARSDLWSVGCVLYELLTARAPFERSSLMQSCAAVLEEEPAPPGDLRLGIPDGLNAAILRCLRKNPDERFDDVAALAEAIAPFGSGRFAGYPLRCRDQLNGEGLARRSTPTSITAVPRITSRVNNTGRVSTTETRMMWAGDLLPPPAAMPHVRRSDTTQVTPVVAHNLPTVAMDPVEYPEFVPKHRFSGPVMWGVSAGLGALLALYALTRNGATTTPDDQRTSVRPRPVPAAVSTPPAMPTMPTTPTQPFAASVPSPVDAFPVVREPIELPRRRRSAAGDDELRPRRRATSTDETTEERAPRRRRATREPDVGF
ncbi:MAG: serine/threonine-protein kinase [Polyangiales bacterium]